VISLPEVVLRAEELNLLLRGMAERLSLNPELITIDQTLRSEENEIQIRRREAEDLIAASPTRAELLDMEQVWQDRKNKYAAWRKTLTDRAKAVDPERVLKLLVDAASAHPNVMRDPHPSALCLGFGDGSLDFELRIWVPQAKMHQYVKSEIVVKVVAALNEDGIGFPLPQREIRVKNMS